MSQQQPPRKSSLTHFSDLPLLNLASKSSKNPSSSRPPSLLPLIPSKTIRSTPVKKRVKTQNITQVASQQCNDSASCRQLSRFIYRHLQKKMDYQQAHHHWSDSGLTKSEHTEASVCGESQINQKSKVIGGYGRKVLPHVYGYQKMKTEHIKIDDSGRFGKKLRQRMYKNQKINLAEHKQLKNMTHIDAYFDLSCLKNVRKDRSYLIVSANHV